MDKPGQSGVLITGGAGFIGCQLTDALIKRDYRVTILDCLDPQIHGPDRRRPDHLNPEARFVLGDVRDKRQVGQVLAGVDVVVHLAGATGVGQSAYEIEHCISTNLGGTASLLEMLAPHTRKRRIKLVLASSRAAQGEGKYNCRQCGVVYPSGRSPERLQAGDWQVYCPRCDKPAEPLPTDEHSQPSMVSFYGLSKLQQEQLCLCFAGIYPISVAALRLVNVYGPGQALFNPYTGILSLFATRLINGQDLEVYEDGEESRDFIHIDDAVRAFLLAIETEVAAEIFNIGTDKPITMHQAAKILLKLYPGATAEQRVKVVGKYRLGDSRNCYCDTRKAAKVLGFVPRMPFEEGLGEWLRWAISQEARDLSDRAEEELAQRDLLGR